MAMVGRKEVGLWLKSEGRTNLPRPPGNQRASYTYFKDGVMNDKILVSHWCQRTTGRQGRRAEEVKEGMMKGRKVKGVNWRAGQMKEGREEEEEGRVDEHTGTN